MSRILFISTMEGASWGGSELLWSLAAERLLVSGHKVFASVAPSGEPRGQLERLADLGAVILERPATRSLWQRGATKILFSGVKGAEAYHNAIKVSDPDLIIVSNGAVWPPVSLATALAIGNRRYINIAQAAHIDLIASDGYVESLRSYAARSEAMLFVSNANRKMTEIEIGKSIEKAYVVRNPYNVPYNSRVEWPFECDQSSTVAFASVARLHIPSKGQDILLNCFSQPIWRERNWRLSLYGSGPNKIAISALINSFNLSDRVTIKGHVNDIPEVWRTHHALLMPSRYEGLPLALVEAMLCGRVVVATDVGGCAEVIENNETGFIADAPTMISYSEALERAWSRRDSWAKIAGNAKVSIKQFIPTDPVGLLVEVLRTAGIER